MKVRILMDHQLGGELIALKGDVLELDDDDAKRKVLLKLAEPADPKDKAIAPRTRAEVERAAAGA